MPTPDKTMEDVRAPESIPAIFITLDGAAKRQMVPWPCPPRIYFALLLPLDIHWSRPQKLDLPKRRVYELESIDYDGPEGSRDPEKMRATYREVES